MNKKLQVKRSELKYFINKLDYVLLVARLQQILKHDQYSEPYKGYAVRSLYFDSLDDECLSDKQSGYIYRAKYRIRTYDPYSDKVKFEIKHKLNSQIFKESASLSRQEAISIIHGDYNCLLQSNEPMLNRTYSIFTKKQYKPKVIVEYDRDAFVYEHFNIRITIDKDLRYSTSNLEQFFVEKHLTPALEMQKYILEIKFDQVLPDFISNIIQLERFERMAISKYTLSRRFTKFKQWEDN